MDKYNFDDFFKEDDDEDFDWFSKKTKKSLLDLFDDLTEDNYKSGHDGTCDGDCENCPNHYGYRYGRWYYGKDHTHGCEFGGNRGGGGII